MRIQFAGSAQILAFSILIDLVQILIFPATLWAQSHPIPLPAVNGQTNRPAVSQLRSGVAIAMPPAHQQWERILDEVHPSISGTMTGSELLAALRELGLPVIFAESCKDDLDVDDKMTIASLPNVPLRDRLLAAMDEFNVTWAFRGNLILVISKDDVDDPEFFTNYTYDITSVVREKTMVSASAISNLIQNSIDPDSWDGNGQGLQTMQPIPVGDRVLLVIAATYTCHRKIQQMFQGFEVLRGNAPSSQIR